ncbi:hypothetical protein BGZ68_000550 [Mortierella alpina]|nr:hypothetical protein BGZ68_000550 [Mortierella alpina]
MSSGTLSFPTRSYRPLQCPTCKQLLSRPFTLPCGFSVCQHCLPPKETINYTTAIRCPFRACSRNGVHSTDELSIDVTLTNLTSAIRAASLESGMLANILSEDTDYLKEHKQPDTLYYGSTVLDPTWSPTLEGLFDPYDEATPAGSATRNPLVKDDPSPMALYHNISVVLDAVRPKIQQEIECQVCFLIFKQPLTTECGHTFCKSCLITSLDYKPTCPLCRRTLPLYMHYHNQRPNKTLVRFLQYLEKRLPPNNDNYHPSNKKDALLRREQEIEISAEEREVEPMLAATPLFINSLVFPRMPCYLLVFEPRYRKMLRNVLRTESKMFGMVLPPRRRKDYDTDRTAWEPSMAYGTLLKVLSCELLPDGRALVETVGLSRFQVLTYSMMDGYYTATAVELVHDIPLEHEVGLEKAMLEAAAQKQMEAERAEAENMVAVEPRADGDHIDEKVADEDDTGLREEVGAIRAQSGKYRQEQEQVQEQDSEAAEELGDRSMLGSYVLSTSTEEAAVAATEPALDAISISSSSASSSSSSSSSSLQRIPRVSSTTWETVDSSTSRAPGTDQVELKDLQQLDLDRLSRKQLMQILLSFVAHMQERLGPQDTLRLQREFGEMVEDEGQYFSFWVASILPVQREQKYGVLQMTSVRQRLVTVVGWIKDLESKRSMSVCTIS